MKGKFERFEGKVLDSAWLLGGVVVTGIVVGTTLIKLNKIWKEL